MRGGAPIHGYGNRGAKRLPTGSTAGGNQQSNAAGQSQASQNVSSNPLVIVTRGSEVISNVKILKSKKPGPMKAASGARVVHRGKVANIMATHDVDYDQQQMSTIPTSSFHAIQSAHAMVNQRTITAKHQRTATATYTISHATKSPMTAAGSIINNDNIVVIDPDDKNCQLSQLGQRIIETIDYDDDNDKSGIIGTEVSLSSVALAQNAIDGDDVSSVIYDTSAGNDFNIVSSDLLPLESEEISEEYQLYPSVFADYMDDGEREHTIDSPTECDDTKSMTVEDTDNEVDDDDGDDEDNDDENEDNDETSYVNLGEKST